MSPLTLCRKCGTSMVGPSRKLMELDELRQMHRYRTYLPPSQMQEYKQKLNDVLEDIKALHSIIDDLEDFAYQTRTVLSPVRFIPNEILCLIFQEVCNDPQPDTRTAPLILASVCARWREVAVDTPHIWTFIYAAARPNRKTTPDLTIPLYLSRSRLMPINIDVATQSNELVSTLCSEAGRWTDVLFNITPPCLTTMYTELHNKRLPNLTSLTFVELMDGTGLKDDAFVSVFEDTPKLHMLCLGGPVVEIGKHPLPFSRISSLVLSWMSEPLGILRTIALCVNAYHISISDTFIECDDESALPDVVTKAPFVSFRIGRTEPARIQHVLPHITAPAMFSLKLAPSDPQKQGTGTFGLAGIIAFVNRSSASLRRLEIAHVRVNDLSLIKLLEATPLLTELYIHQQSSVPGFITDTLIKRLTIDRTGHATEPPLLPNLKSMLFNWQRRSRPLKKADLMRMVESRAPLEFVDVTVDEVMKDSGVEVVDLTVLDLTVKARVLEEVESRVVKEEADVPRGLKAVTFRGFEEAGDDTLGEAEEVMGRLRRVPRFRMMYDHTRIQGPG